MKFCFLAYIERMPFSLANLYPLCVTVSSHSYWLQAFNDCALNFEDGGAVQGAPYKNGEMRAVALRWT